MQIETVGIPPLFKWRSDDHVPRSRCFMAIQPRSHSTVCFASVKHGHDPDSVFALEIEKDAIVATAQPKTL